MDILKQSTAVTIVMGPMLDSTDGNTQETGLTIAQADIRLSKNGGAYAQTNNVAGATHMEVGKYSVPLDTTDTGTLGKLRVDIHESGALAVWREFTIVPANVYDSLVLGTDVLTADVTQWLGTAAATPTVAGVPEVDITHMAGGVQTVTDLKDFADAGYDPATNKVQGVVLVDTTTTNTDLVSAADVVNEWETQSQADPTGFHVNVLEIGGTAQTANDNGADINAILGDTNELQTDWVNGGRLDLILDIIAADTTTDIPATISTMQGNVTDILADTNELQGDWTNTGRLDTILDTIAVDTTTDIPALIATAQTDLDIITGTDGVTLATLQALYAPNKVVPDVAGTAATLHGVTDSKVDAVQTDATAIKAKTDNLPSGIAKNVALSNFQAYMVLSSDHVTAATGKTLTGTISKDGGAFASLTNAITEIANGLYKVNITQTEMNADVITLKFTETDCDQRVVVIHTT